jgi:hypothetical protein
MNEKRSKTMADMVWMNNGAKNTRVRTNDVEAKKLDGFAEGRLPLGVSQKLGAFLATAHKRAGKLKKFGYTDEMVEAERNTGNRWCSWHKKFESASLFGSTKQLICREAWNEAGQSRRYGMGRGWYVETLAKQNGHCALCPAKINPGKRTGRFCVDHDHACCPGRIGSCGKCVRGLLCHGCNVKLGHLEDFLRQVWAAPPSKPGTWLEKALAYLQSYEKA